MSYTTVTVGRLTLRETFELNANISAGTDTRTLVLAGEESSPPLTSIAEVKRRQEDILGLQNKLVPIRFGTKADHDGWYRITDVNTSVRDYQGNELRAFAWGLNAQRIGSGNAVDLESRLTGASRINDHGLTGERWHAPAAGAYAYHTGTTQPSGAVQRSTADGVSITAWRSVPASANPRWAVTLENYGNGRVRIETDGYERSAAGIDLVPDSWRLDNGLVYVTPSASGFSIACWDGSAWDVKAWSVGIAASTVGATFNAASVLRNDYELCTIRLVKDRAPGRAELDLTLRRGSRFVEGYLRSDSSTLLAVFRDSAETSTATASTGYVRATSNDADGNRFVVGSARSFTGLTVQGGLSKTSTTTLDFFIGAEVGGTTAVAGDQAANLTSQYLTAMGEVTLAALR